MVKSKQFKRFDKEFKNTRLVITDRQRSLALHKNQWTRTVSEHSQHIIKHATYAAEGYMEWQQFRVGLKGLSTALKLVLLEDRYLIKVIDGSNWAQQHLERVRIDNYINALRRGGLLDSEYRVIK